MRWTKRPTLRALDEVMGEPIDNIYGLVHLELDESSVCSSENGGMFNTPQSEGREIYTCLFDLFGSV